MIWYSQSAPCNHRSVRSSTFQHVYFRNSKCESVFSSWPGSVIICSSEVMHKHLENTLGNLVGEIFLMKLSAEEANLLFLPLATIDCFAFQSRFWRIKIVAARKWREGSGLKKKYRNGQRNCGNVETQWNKGSKWCEENALCRQV